MRTYAVKFKFKDGYEATKYIPSFSVEEAKEEFLWLMREVYDEEPQILGIEELPPKGCV